MNPRTSIKTRVVTVAAMLSVFALVGLQLACIVPPPIDLGGGHDRRGDRHEGGDRREGGGHHEGEGRDH